MRHALTALIYLFFVSFAISADPTAGQNTIQKRKSSGNGFEFDSWTWTAGTLLGRYANGTVGPVVIGSNLTLTAGGTLNATGGGGSGTVTSVAVSGSDGIEIDSGSPVTTSGTIALGVNAAALSSHLGLGTMASQPATSPTITTSIVTGSTSFTAFAGATTLLTIGGTGATATVTIPGTEAATGTAGVGALNVAGGANFVTDIWAHGIRLGHGNSAVSTNVAVGASALNAITTAGQNVAIGNDAMLGETGGAGGNVAVGYQAQRSASAGLNTALGHKSLYSNNGYDNTAVGQASGYYNTTGYQNVTLGRNAGIFQADGVTALTTANTSVYIGYEARGLSNTDSNSIVISGTTGIGEGANTTVIGNNSTTQSHLFGTLLTDASTTTRAGFRLPHGTAPTSPVNGDIWTTSAGGLYAQINGSTVGPIGASGLTVGTTTITSGTSGRLLYNNAGVVGELPLGTGVATTLATNLSITGGGSISLGGFDFTVPATGTAALLGTANTFTAAQAVTVGTNSATPADGVNLTNSTAAISGTQSASPSTAWTGQGWKTTATAASQSVAFKAFVLPVQGTTAPTGAWTLQSSINSGAYSTALSVDSAGLLSATSGVFASDFRFQAGTAGSIISPHGGEILIKTADTYSIKFRAAGTFAAPTMYYGWSDGTAYSGTADTFLYRGGAAATVEHGADVNGDAVDQVIKAADGITGTDRSGADFDMKSGLGTGAGAVSKIVFSTPNVLASGTTAQSYTERMRINSSGITIGSGTAIAKVKHGTATLVAGTVTVSDSDVVAGSRIFVNRQTDGGTLGDSYSITITAATNFVIQSKTASANVAGDTSTVSWIMVNP